MNNHALNYRDIILKHKRGIVGSRSNCNISTSIAGKKITSPVICSNMKSILNVDICKIFDTHGMFHIYHRIDGIDDIFNYVKIANEENWNFVSISIGIKDVDFNLLQDIKHWNYRLDSICIDVAFSWQSKVESMIITCRQLFPNAYLIVGNGDNPEWIKWLEKLNVDCAKINIGVSTACKTREFTGFGSSTVTDLINCSLEAKNIKIMSDGGLTVENDEVWIGDIAKAIRFGADYVMSGALFSRCINSPSIINGYYGNASRTAKGNSHVEGTNLNVNTNGLTIEKTIQLIEDSLKSSVSYAGGNTLDALKYVDYQIISS